MTMLSPHQPARPQGLQLKTMSQPSLPVRILRALARAAGLGTRARASYHRLRRWRHPLMVWPSETSKCRARPHVEIYSWEIVTEKLTPL
jgi:hypothetical protein